MTIAELFVNLGVKGDGELKKSLTGAKSGLGEVKTMSLEAKVAILAVVAGLQQLMSTSGKVGSNLVQFETTTGLSADTLQRYQYAARKMNVENEEMEQNIRNVQKAMQDMITNKKPPEGMAKLAPYLKLDLRRALDPFYVIQQLQEAAKKIPPQYHGLLKEAFASFGISEGVYGALIKQVFNPKNLAAADVYTKTERDQLRKNHAGYLELGDSIAKGIGRLNARFGPQLIKDLKVLVPEILKLVEAFAKLAESSHLLGIMDEIFKGWGLIFDKIRSVIDDVNGEVKDMEKGPKVKVDDKAGFLERWRALKDYFNSDEGKALVKQQTQPYAGRKPTKGDLDFMGNVVPNAGNLSLPATTPTVNVNQNLNFQHDGRDHQKNSKSHREAVQKAYREHHAQGQGG